MSAGWLLAARVILLASAAVVTGCGGSIEPPSRGTGSAGGTGSTGAAYGTGGGAASVARFAYVANEFDNTVGIYTVNAATGRLRANGFVTTGTNPHSLAVSPTGKFVYVVNRTSNNVSAYVIGANGMLSPVAGSPFATGTNPQSITIEPKGGFAYVVNQNSNTISAFSINATSGAFTPVAGSPFALAGALPSPATAVVVDPTGKFAYAAGYNSIWAFTINATSGALTPVTGSPFTGSVSPYFMAIDPLAKFLYLTDQMSGNVYSYAINTTTGALAATGTPVAAGMLPYSVAVHPSGQFAYVANGGLGGITAYAINATTGSLTAIAGGAVSMVGTPCSISIDPTGKFLYVTNFTYDDLWTFSINTTTGLLTLLGKIGARNYPVSMALANGGTPVSYTPKFAYAANSASYDISAYSINATTGALTSLGATVPAGTNPQSIATDPWGRFAYVANYMSNNVSGYTVNATSGALTSVGAMVAAGTNPQSVTVDPSGRFAYVANYTTGDVSAYSINQITGALTQIACGAVTGGACGATIAANFAAGSFPMSVTADPMGMYLYVTNFGTAAAGSSISAYLVNPVTGALTGVSGSPFYVGAAGAVATVVSPTGESAYVTFNTGSVSLVTVGRSNGLLRPYVGSATGASPTSPIIDLTGSFVYVSNSFNGAGGNSISGYSVNASSGLLSAIAGTPFMAGSAPNSLALDSSGRFVYVTNSFNGAGGNSVSAFTLNAATGALNPIAGAPYAAGTGPSAITTTGSVQ